MMSFEDWRDRITLGLISLLVPGVIYIVSVSINSASEDFVEEAIAKALLTGPYRTDKVSITHSIEDLYTITAKLMADLEHMRESQGVANKKNYEDIIELRLQLDRLRTRYDIHEQLGDSKRKEPRRAPERSHEKEPNYNLEQSYDLEPSVRIPYFLFNQFNQGFLTQ